MLFTVFVAISTYVLIVTHHVKLPTVRPALAWIACSQHRAAGRAPSPPRAFASLAFTRGRLRGKDGGSPCGLRCIAIAIGGVC